MRCAHSALAFCGLLAGDVGQARMRNTVDFSNGDSYWLPNSRSQVLEFQDIHEDLPIEEGLESMRNEIFTCLFIMALQMN